MACYGVERRRRDRGRWCFLLFEEGLLVFDSLCFGDFGLFCVFCIFFFSRDGVFVFFFFFFLTLRPLRDAGERR